MNFVIEDGYNSEYITILIISLFFTESMIERGLLIENKTNNYNGIYLQRLIRNNFVLPMRNDTCITSDIINEIRLFLFLNDWNMSFEESEPLKLLNFLCTKINVFPIETTHNKYSHVELSPNDRLSTSDSCIQTLYDNWAKQNIIINIPMFIVFKIKVTNKLQINKKIRLLQDEHKYDVKWAFHSIFFRSKKIGKFIAIMNKYDKLYKYDSTQIPNISICNENELSLNKNCEVCVIYRKEPTI